MKEMGEPLYSRVHECGDGARHDEGDGQQQEKKYVEFPFRFVNGGAYILPDFQYAENFSGPRVRMTRQATGLRLYRINVYNDGIVLIGDGITCPE